MHEVAGLFIGDKVLALRSPEEPVQYLGDTDDIAFMKLSLEKESDICSAFVNVQQVDNTVNAVIESVKLINEHQILKKDNKIEFEAFVTRAILFKFKEGLELMFEKDNWIYSDCIVINKGYALESRLSDIADFSKGWEQVGVVAECTRSKVIFK